MRIKGVAGEPLTLDLDLKNHGHTSGSFNPLLLRLDRIGSSETADYRDLNFGETRLILPRRDIVSDGEVVSRPLLLLAGIACRYKMMHEGRRAIVGFLVPGDLVSPWCLEDQKVDFAACASVHVITRLRPVCFA